MATGARLKDLLKSAEDAISDIKDEEMKRIAFERVLIINVANEEKFRRNYRVRAVEIQANDFPGIPFRGDIPNANDRPHPVPVETNATTELRIEIEATWPSEAVGGGQAFDELAIQELEFWGRKVSNGSLERE